MPFSASGVPRPPGRFGLVAILGTSLAIGLLAGSLWIARGDLRGIEATNTLAHQVQTAQFAAETLMSTLKDAETGQRGYLLTDDLSYLEPYAGARARLSRDFERLDQAPFKDAVRADLIASLRNAAATKMAELARTISLHQSGQTAAALELVRTNHGRNVMNDIRREVEALQNDAQIRLDRARVQSLSSRAWRGAAAGTLAVVGCLLLGGIILMQSRANRVVTAAYARLAAVSGAFGAADAERQRANALLHAIVETAPGLIYAKDRQGRMLLANAAAMALIGKPWDEVRGRTDAEFLDNPQEGEAVMLNDRRIMQTGVPEEIEELVGQDGAQIRVWLSTKTPLLDEHGAIVGLVGISVEITERKRMEDRMRLMINELNHRVKNTLATVQSIAMQTLRGTDAQIRSTLEMRLIALAAAHDALTHERWQGANLVDIVTAILAPHGGLEGGRVQFGGPHLRLTPHATIAMALGLHELATNALKYGALSVDGGHVEAAWEIVSGETAQFRFVWTERNGPPVVPPDRRGFGSKLIESSLARDIQGVAVIRFERAGVVCEIGAPLSEIVAPANVALFPTIGRL